MNKREIKNFLKAKSLTELSDFNKIHIGCVAVLKSKVIGVGYNTYKTHPKQKHFDSYRELTVNGAVDKMHSLHAEISCLISIKNDNIPWDKVELYIYRKKYSKPFGLARPCPACMQMIKSKGIKHIYYTTEDGLAYENLAMNLLEEDSIESN